MIRIRRIRNHVIAWGSASLLVVTSACKTRGVDSEAKSNSGVEVPKTSQMQDYLLGMGVDVFTGNTTQTICVIQSPESGPATNNNAPPPPPPLNGGHAVTPAPTGLPNLPAGTVPTVTTTTTTTTFTPASSPKPGMQLADGDTDEAESAAADDPGGTPVTLAAAPDMGDAEFGNGLIPGDNLLSDDQAKSAWQGLLMAGGQVPQANSDTSFGLDGGSQVGFTYHVMLYDNAASAKNDLKAGAAATFSAFSLGDLKLSAGLESILNQSQASQYLIIEGAYNGPADLIRDSVFAKRVSGKLDRMIQGDETAKAAARKTFNDQCSNTFVSGVIHGARIRIVAAVTDQQQGGTTNASVNGDLKAGTVTAQVSDVKEYLKRFKTTNIYAEMPGGVPVEGQSLETVMKAFDDWVAGLKSLNGDAKSLPVQYAILEPYTLVSQYYKTTKGDDGKPVQTIEDVTDGLFAHPLASPRGETLKLYRSFYFSVINQIDLLQAAIAQGGKYQADLQKAQDYRKALVDKANACIDNQDQCKDRMGPPPNPSLPPPTKPAPPPLPEKPLVGDFAVAQDYILSWAGKFTYDRAIAGCASVKGGFGLPTTDQLRYLLKHREMQYKGYSIDQWITGDGVWTKNIYKKSDGYEYHTIFSMDNALHYPDKSAESEVRRTSKWQWENTFYTVCVKDP